MAVYRNIVDKSQSQTTNMINHNELRNQNHEDIIKKYLMNYPQNNDSELNHNYQNKIKIVIYAPPIDIACGGIMVMYNLAKTINDLNLPNIQCLVYSYDHIKYHNSFCNNYFNPLLMDDKTIVIYPETIIGNPLNSKYVIRWILLELGLEMPAQQYRVWDKNDLVYHWEPSKLSNSKQLVNIWINPLIKKYNNNSNYRNRNCYGIKKMQWIPHALHSKIEIIHNKKDIWIDKLSINRIISVFNTSKIFYCYDPNTFFSIMAPLCGCVTVLHPIDGVSKEEYFNSRILCYKNEFCYNAGIAYGNTQEEINSALSSVNNAQSQFEKLCQLYQITINNFISDIISLINNKQLPNTVNNLYYSI